MTNRNRVVLIISIWIGTCITSLGVVYPTINNKVLRKSGEKIRIQIGKVAAFSEFRELAECRESTSIGNF